MVPFFRLRRRHPTLMSPPFGPPPPLRNEPLPPPHTHLSNSRDVTAFRGASPPRRSNRVVVSTGAALGRDWDSFSFCVVGWGPRPPPLPLGTPPWRQRVVCCTSLARGPSKRVSDTGGPQTPQSHPPSTHRTTTRRAERVGRGRPRGAAVRRGRIVARESMVDGVWAFEKKGGQEKIVERE